MLMVVDVVADVVYGSLSFVVAHGSLSVAVVYVCMGLMLLLLLLLLLCLFV